MTFEPAGNATTVRTLSARGLTWRGSYARFGELVREAELWMQQDWETARTLHDERLADELARFATPDDEADSDRALRNEVSRQDAKNFARLQWQLDGPVDQVVVQARESRDSELFLTGTGDEVTKMLQDATALPLGIDLRGRLDATKRIRMRFDEFAGCEVEVSSADHDWGQRTFAALEKRMRVSQPGWRWLSGPVGWLVRLVVTLAVLALLVPATELWLPAAIHRAPAYYLGLGLLVGTAVFFFFEWFAPRFLITDHGRARVRLSVASISAALIIGFLGGLLVSLLPIPGL